MKFMNEKQFKTELTIVTSQTDYNTEWLKLRELSGCYVTSRYE